MPKLVKLPGRKPGIKSDINVRFLTEREYTIVCKAARLHCVSINLFITRAALHAAGDRALAQAALATVSALAAAP